MVYFMHQDVIATQDCLEARTVQYREKLNKIEQVKEIHKTDSYEIPKRPRDKCEFYQKCIAQCQSKSQIVSTMPRVLGNIPFSSRQRLWHESTVPDLARFSKQI